MALVQWKAGLPDCSQTWSEQDEPNTLITNVDVGPPKVRRRSTLEMRTVNLSWTLDAKLYALFMEFFETDCLQGINEFEYRHPITKEINRYRFVQSPKIEMIMGHNKVAAFRVSCQWQMQFNSQPASPVINAVNNGNPIRLDASNIVVSWQNGAYQSVDSRLNSVTQSNHNIINSLTTQFDFVYPQNAATKMGQSMVLQSGGVQFITPVLIPEIGFSYVTVNSFSGNAPIANDGDQYIYPNTDSNGNTITVSEQGEVEWSGSMLPYQDITLRILDGSNGIITDGYVVNAPIPIDPELILDEPFNDLIPYTIDQPSEISLVTDTYGKAMNIESNNSVTASRNVQNIGLIHYVGFKFKFISNTGDGETLVNLVGASDNFNIWLNRGVGIDFDLLNIAYPSLADNIWYELEAYFDGVTWFVELLDAQTQVQLGNDELVNEFVYQVEQILFHNLNDATVSDEIRFSEIKVAPFNVLAETFTNISSYTESSPSLFSVVNDNYGSALQIIGSNTGFHETLSKAITEMGDLLTCSFKFKCLTDTQILNNRITIIDSDSNLILFSINPNTGTLAVDQFPIAGPPAIFQQNLGVTISLNVWYGIVSEFDSVNNEWTFYVYNLDSNTLLNTVSGISGAAIDVDFIEFESGDICNDILISDFLMNARVNL